MLREHEINNSSTFICGWYLNDTTICDKLIEYHKSSEKKFEGRVGNGVIKSQKDSIDVTLDASDVGTQYCDVELQSVIDLYRKKYIFSDLTGPWKIREHVNIQHYPPGAGFKAWHMERSTIATAKRHLVFMTYLNDVTEGGETEFYYQKIKIKPEKGLTLIWGSDWTFTHRGIPSMTQEKYIVTGWYSFYDLTDIK
jgi:hypothetical protein